MKITVCIGSSCHIKGSRQVVEKLQELISRSAIGDSVELDGTFCMGKCQQGVCVTVDGTFFSVSPDNVKQFFDNVIQIKVISSIIIMLLSFLLYKIITRLLKKSEEKHCPNAKGKC